MRHRSELVKASMPFAREIVSRSWANLCATLLALGAVTFLTLLPLPWYASIPISILMGLVLVRMFVMYHDYQHGVILNRSPLARLIMNTFGVVTLTPPSIWNRSHNYHHKHNSKTFGSDIGSFPIMTTEAYAKATPFEKWKYRTARHPITILLGYLTIFAFGMCLRPLINRPKDHLDSAYSLAIHLSILVCLGIYAPEIMWKTVVIPMAVACSVGSYIFYAQHNFPAAKIKSRGEWDPVFAALNSSSYMKMNKVMHWFTANIGYHHIHHLNSRIPFYRLPEAMEAMKELQSPGRTSLAPVEIYRCLRLKLWDPNLDRFVTFKESRLVA